MAAKFVVMGVVSVIWVVFGFSLAFGLGIVLGIANCLRHINKNSQC